MPQTPPFLMIGTPCFGGQVSTIYAFSLLQLQQACARRGVNLGYLMQAGDAQAGRTPLESATLSYVVEGELSNGLISRQGFVKARYAGTGFLMIRRAALESMIEHYPKLRYRSEHKANDPFEGNPWRSALFNCMIDPETSTYLSEDFSFCRRWTSMGGEIWVDLTSKLDHVGSMVFRGNLAARVDLPREPEEPAKPEPPDDSAGH